MTDPNRPQPVMTPAEVSSFIDREFPQIHDGGRLMTIEAIPPLGARVRMAYHERLIRPGGTISGPSMFALGDFSMYVAVLGAIGPVPLAVTTSFNINFLRRPEPRDMICHVSLIKLGKRLAVGDIALYSDHVDDMVAHATATYSVPPPDKR